jgi:hypothetical protein
VSALAERHGIKLASGLIAFKKAQAAGLPA